MIKYNKEELKELIRNGFDIELISFELDIPQDILKKIKSEIETESNSVKKEKIEITKSKIDLNPKSTKSKTYTYEEFVDIRNKEAHAKMQEMRGRYKELFSQTTKTVPIVREELSQNEIEQINQSIKVIENIVEEIKNYSKKEKLKEIRHKAFDVQEELKKIKDYQLTIEQAEKLNDLLDVEQLKKLNIRNNGKIDLTLNNYRKEIARKLAEAVDYAQYQTENLEQLIILEKKLTSKLMQQNQLFVGAVKNRINSKINKIRQQQAVEKIKNDIPSSIIEIVNDLVNDEIDIEKANETIEKEAKSRVESKTNTKFALTQEQEKRQILLQIEKAISNQASRFHIVNPEKTIVQIYKLSGESLQSATIAVVENLISEKRYEEATEICNKLSNKNKEREFIAFVQNLRHTIRNAKISEIVLKAINTNGEKEERKYYELIKTYIEKENIKLGAIHLGKNKDGTRNITLADIWPEAKRKGRG